MTDRKEQIKELLEKAQDNCNHWGREYIITRYRKE